MVSDSVPTASRDGSRASSFASSRGTRTPPRLFSLSGTVNRRRRGTSGRGLTILISYCSGRPSVPISIVSRNPSVVTSEVVAPLRSRIALVASVVP